MAIVDKCILHEGKSILENSSIQLEQIYNDHHKCTITTDFSNDEQLSHGDIESLLGAFLDIQINSRGTQSGIRFIGFVDTIVPAFTQEGAMTLQIEVYAPTLQMDIMPKFRTYSATTIEQIFTDILSEYQVKVFPKLKQNGPSGLAVDYAFQAQESDFRFLLRLADRMGKTWTYDGFDLILGELDEYAKPSTTLRYGTGELDDLRLAINLAPLSFGVKGYVRNTDQVEEQENEDIPNTDDLIKSAIDKSKLVYSTSWIRVNHFLHEGKLAKTIERFRSKVTHDLVALTATTSVPELTIGSVITIENKSDREIPMSSESRWTIIQISHHVSDTNDYVAHFLCIPAEHPFNLRSHRAGAPFTGPLIGIVEETPPANSAEAGQVKVRYLLDENETAIWMPLVVPTTASGGVYLPPKAGERVIVMFVDNDCHSPFVLGSFYTPHLTPAAFEDRVGIISDGTVLVKAEKIIFEAQKMEMKAGVIQAIAEQEIIQQARKKIKSNADAILLNCKD
ncbi:MAG: contractile injection system protein, VgrG/Pvc8 family [Bacteroidota bacterium]